MRNPKYYKCVVENCIWDKKQPLFQFPRDENGAFLWLQIIEKTHLYDDVIKGKFIRICGKHFSSDMFARTGRRLLPGAVPNFQPLKDEIIYRKNRHDKSDDMDTTPSPLPDPEPVKVAFRTDTISFKKFSSTVLENPTSEGLPDIIYADLPAHVVVEVQFIEKDKVTSECLQSLEAQENRMRNETPKLFINKTKKQYDKLIDPDVIVLSDEEESYDSHNETTAAPSPAPSDQTSNDKSLPGGDWISYETDTNTASPPTTQVNYSMPARTKIVPRTRSPTAQEIMKEKLINKQSLLKATSGINKQTYFIDPSESLPTSSTRSYPGKIQSAISIKNVITTSTATVDNAVARANVVKKPTKKIVLFSEDGKMKSISVPHLVLTDAAVQTSLNSKYIPRQTQSIQAVAKTREAGVVTDFSYLVGCHRCLSDKGVVNNVAGTQCELDTERFELTEETDEISPDDYKIYKSGKHECLICGQIFRNYENLCRHMKDHGEKSTLCLFCGKIFTSDTRLQIHEQKRHSNNKSNFKPKKLHICPYRKCEQMYETLIDLYDHINIHIGEKPHKCSCGKSFTSYKQYKFHLLKYKCSKIGYEYPYSYLCNTKQEYTKDLYKFYTREKVIVGKYKKRKFTLNKFQCKYCRKILKNHFALSIHMQKVHPSKVKYKINSKSIPNVVVVV